MEVILRLLEKNIVLVECEGDKSHEFDLKSIHNKYFLKKSEKNPNRLNEEMLQWGEALYKVFVKKGSLLSKNLEKANRITLVCQDSLLQAIPWELMHEDENFLVCKFPFLRAIPPEKRIAPPKKLEELHIVGVFSSPLSDNISPLDTERDWLQLRQIIQPLPYVITLERSIPPTLRYMRSLLAGKKGLVLHFNGHGGQEEDSGYLLFEKSDGSPGIITTKNLLSRVENIPFLVDLNACVSATMGPSDMNNIALSLVEQGIPYTIGMQFPIGYQDARLFSNVFYAELARGSSVETAITQARLEISSTDSDKWIIGIPVLYTSLKSSSGGFKLQKGTPEIQDHQPIINLYQIPSAEGGFQGRNKELKRLGKLLTSQDRPHLITIHAGPGTGKTSLAREAARRFAYAFPGGVCAISMEDTTTLESFLVQLSSLLNIPIAGKEGQIDVSVLNALSSRDTLLVLDNIESLLHKIDARDKEAIALAQFIKQELRETQTTLLLTSWELTGWPNEKSISLSGLKNRYGVELFNQWVTDPARKNKITSELAKHLSNKVGGHPLSLRLLGGSFNTIALSMGDFIDQVEKILADAQDRYSKEDHRHRSLFACFDASLHFLEEDLKGLLFNLQVFRAPFIPEMIVDALDQGNNREGEQLPVHEQLLKLQQKGWLNYSCINLKDGQIEMLQLPPAARIFLERYHALGKRISVSLMQEIAKVYKEINRYIYHELDKGPLPQILFQIIASDMENSIQFLSRKEQASNMNYLGWVFWRLGYWKKGLKYYESALPIRREVGDRSGEAATLNNIGLLYHSIGQPQKALEFYNQALPVMREVGDRSGEAATLNNIGGVYHSIGQPQKALEFYNQAFPIRREVGDRSGEAATLNNIGGVYDSIGQPQEALEFYKLALPIMKEVGNRGGEAALLDNISSSYDLIGNIIEAIDFKKRALQVLIDSKLPCDAGGTTKIQVEKELLKLKRKMEGENE